MLVNCVSRRIYCFFFTESDNRPDLHSFPTRRSSDLDRLGAGDRAEHGQHQVREAVAAAVQRRRLPLGPGAAHVRRSEEHTSELQSRPQLVCRLLLEKKKTSTISATLRLSTPPLLPTP